MSLTGAANVLFLYSLSHKARQTHAVTAVNCNRGDIEHHIVEIFTAECIEPRQNQPFTFVLMVGLYKLKRIILLSFYG